ncbi:glutathione S-transferase N-terminal domain-containing protein [Ochrobactrum vermis]|uniref:Glutathione S-transferase N-terminal domain-containing protein n=1 Tax=Ochrobactrum vermis TaxID=1827297 RepID=A0ABU8PFV6_9HYPH|nr:glutathione S-transferase N-terminal domain-containing protein [Ochrobactrum vermis]PQZ25396.1 glutathione S-transferase [Ochrobactrum vermis]
MYRLYYSPGACSLAVHIALEEVGVAYELELRSTKDSEGTSTPDFLALNPKGRVPSLLGVSGRSGGAQNLLTEAPAILIYLAETHPNANLLPTDFDVRARCIEWLNWLSGTVHSMSYGQLWRPHRFVSDEALFASVQAKGRANLIDQYAYIESIMSDGRSWAVPQGYSVADAFLLVFWRWGMRIDIDMYEAYPAWTRATARTFSRPAVRRALLQEGLDGETELSSALV